MRFVQDLDAKARPAATVVLLRPAPGGQFEVYALQRAASMAFAAGMYAFPGGVVDPHDFADALPWAGPRLRWWATRLGLAEPGVRAVICAAVRELFEECGVLLAGPDRTEPVGEVATSGETDRVALLERRLSLAALLTTRGLLLRSDLLVPWARWLTPVGQPRRFDTYFFLARLPAAQRTRDVGSEAQQRLWLAPGHGGDLPMLPPTATTLRQLSAYRTVDEVWAAAHAGARSRGNTGYREGAGAVSSAMPLSRRNETSVDQ